MKNYKKHIITLSLATICLLGLNKCWAQEISKEEIKYYHQQVALQRRSWDMAGFINACMKGEYRLVEYYLKGGFNPNEPYFDSTPLIMAIYSGNVKTVETLLKNGADPNLKRASLSPLHFAIRRKNSEIVKLLIKYNADVNQECKNIKPINFAIKKKSDVIVKDLLEAGAIPDEKTAKLAKKTKNTKIQDLF